MDNLIMISGLVSVVSLQSGLGFAPVATLNSDVSVFGCTSVYSQ